MQDSIPKYFNATERPPQPGGWHYFLDPTTRRQLVKHHAPGDVFNELQSYRRNNGTHTSDEALWRELWAYWCSLEPHRCPVVEEVELPMPSVATQAKSALGAVARVIKAAVTLQPVIAHNSGQREAVCNACEYYDRAQQRCRQCGCLIALKSKLATERCPLGRW